MWATSGIEYVVIVPPAIRLGEKVAIDTPTELASPQAVELPGISQEGRSGEEGGEGSTSETIVARSKHNRTAEKQTHRTFYTTNKGAQAKAETHSRMEHEHACFAPC